MTFIEEIIRFLWALLNHQRLQYVALIEEILGFVWNPSHKFVTCINNLLVPANLGSLKSKDKVSTIMFVLFLTIVRGKQRPNFETSNYERNFCLIN